MSYPKITYGFDAHSLLRVCPSMATCAKYVTQKIAHDGSKLALIYVNNINAVVTIQLLLYNKYFNFLSQNNQKLNNYLKEVTITKEHFFAIISRHCTLWGNSMLTGVVTLNVFSYFIHETANIYNIKFFNKILKKNEYKNYVIKDEKLVWSSMVNWLKDEKISFVISKNIIIHFLLIFYNFFDQNLSEFTGMNAIGKYIINNSKLVVYIQNLCMNALNILKYYCKDNQKFKEKIEKIAHDLLIVVTPWHQRLSIIVNFSENGLDYSEVHIEQYESVYSKNSVIHKSVMELYKEESMPMHMEIPRKIIHSKLAKKVSWKFIKLLERRTHKLKLTCSNIKCTEMNETIETNKYKRGWKWKLYMCKRCRMVYYCSRKCQKADWKHHNHRIICAILRN